MRTALVVGIDHYDHSKPLFGCINDARAVKRVLERHEDDTINFDCRLLTSTNNRAHGGINRRILKDNLSDLFSQPAEISLFYFAGHGHIETTGGYLLTTDSQQGDDGLPLSEVVTLANNSPAQNRIIILDSCHSGIAGTPPGPADQAVLSEGLTILTASTPEQYATEKNGSGVFTNLLLDALQGGASNLTGEITPGSIYAHIDQSLGAWEQRPVFKTNVRSFVSLRTVNAPIRLRDLRKLSTFFPTAEAELKLNPTFEPELRGRTHGMPEPKPENTEVFAILQMYNRLNLLVPVGANHMWNAAMESKSCHLTKLGQHYWRLIKNGRI